MKNYSFVDLPIRTEMIFHLLDFHFHLFNFIWQVPVVLLNNDFQVFFDQFNLERFEKLVKILLESVLLKLCSVQLKLFTVYRYIF